MVDPPERKSEGPRLSWLNGPYGPAGHDNAAIRHSSHPTPRQRL